MSSVTGQVLATDETFRNVAGFPTEATLASKVLDLPALTQGTVLCDSIARGTDAGKLVKFAVEHGKGKWLSRRDTFSVLDYEGEPFDGLVVVENSNIIGKTRIVVQDKDEKPIMLAVEETLKINKAYFLYSTSPLFKDDAQAETEGGVAFYPMFKVRDIDDNHVEYRSLLIWNGNNYQPYLHLVPARNLPDTPTGKLVPPRKNDVLLVDPKDLDVVYALLSKKAGRIFNSSRAGWDCVVAPGADVGMTILLSVILNDMVGWFA